MVNYQKSFFDNVPQKFGLIHLKNELKGQARNSGHLELPGLTDPAPQDNFVAVHILKDCDFDVDEGRWVFIIQDEDPSKGWTEAAAPQ